MEKKLESDEQKKPEGANLALLDPAVLTPVYEWNQTGKPLNVAGVLCLFQLSEAIVLHDSLLVPDSWRYGEEPLEKADRAWLRSVSDCFRVHKDLTTFSVAYGITNDQAFDQAFGFCMHLENTFKPAWDNLKILSPAKTRGYALILSDALNIVHRGWNWNAPFILNPFWEHFFQADDDSTQGLQQIHEKMAAGFTQQIEKLKNLGAPIPIAVPPIPALALERSNGNPLRYWAELSEIREQFAPCRKKFAELYERFSSPTEEIGKLIQARRELIDEVQAVATQVSKGPTDGRLLSEFWDVVGTVEESKQPVEVKFSASANFKGIVMGLLKWFKTYRIKRRARAIFDLYDKSLRIQNYGKLLSSKIAKIDAAELESFKMHAQHVESLLHTERKP